MFRQLYHQLTEYRGDSVYEEVLMPALEQAQVAVASLARFRLLGTVGGAQCEDTNASWQLYALGRVNDFLLLPFQEDERGAWGGPRVSRQQYLEFFMRLGMTPFTCAAFSPFYYEIAKVEQAADPAEPIRVREHFWPGLMFGEMVFSRSGVRVRAGTPHVIKEVAEQSTLYFTYRRLHRRTEDLSMGWGSNSQWRTDYRRDYVANGTRYYNIVGKNRLGDGVPAEPDRDGLTPEERIELCQHRCFIRSRREDRDLWPYHDRWEESP
ncbi:hypothetical protein AYO44_09280 [Planctomycetaceae bacterium SCGC AG-212-F19]|nr:hypothetical protein AYO44_09280 [Planctomycetaceae bacterium SCGC AG-212-F19]